MMTFDYNLKAYASVDPQQIEQMWAEEALPGMLAGLKHYVETGEPMPKIEAVN